MNVMTAATYTVPRYTPAQARRDYAQREAERYRRQIRELWNRGVRRPGEIAAELNRLDILSTAGWPWKSAAVARTLKLLKFDRAAAAVRDADALEWTLSELWGVGYRIPRQLARVLTRLEILCPWGGSWTSRTADRLVQYHVGEWRADGAGVRLRHGDDALKLDGVPELPALGRRRAAPPAVPAVLCEPQGPTFRRRAIRARS